MNKLSNTRSHAMRLLLITAILTVTPLESLANGLKFECPADEAEPQLSLNYQADSLVVSDGKTTATLPATFRGAPNEFAIQATGPLESLMPDLAAMDKCIAAGLTDQNTTAQDLGVLTYLIVNCRSKTLKTSTQQKVQASIVVTVAPDEPNSAYLGFDRNYLTPSTVSGTFLSIPQLLPIRKCSFVME